MRSLVVLLVLALPASAQERTHAVVPDDLFTLATVTGLTVAPDGKQVAYTEARWDKADDLRKTDLWIVTLEQRSKPVRLTGDRANDRNPKWAADNKSIYVLGNRKREAEKKPPYDGSTQIWKVPVDGGTPTAVTRVEGGVTGFDYSPKAEVLFYSTETTARDADDFAKLREKFDRLEFGHAVRKVSEVFSVDCQTWRTARVLADNRYIREFAASPDGARLGMITALDDTVIRSEGGSRVDVFETATGKVTPTDDSWKKTAASPYPWLEGIAWNPAGTRLAFNTIFDAYPAEIIVQDSEPGSWTASRVRRPDGYHVHGYGSPLRWLDDRAVGYLGEKNGTIDVFAYGMASKASSGVPRDGLVVADFAITPTGGAVTYEGTATAFPELVLRGQESRTLTDLNPQTKTWKRPGVSHVTWKAPDGTEVGGVLEVPFDFQGDKKYPLVVAIHGGPTTSTTAGLALDAHNGRGYFPTKDYVVLLPNYRGSTGYGDKFVTDLIGQENDIDVKDILAGIQHLVAEGIADPNRVAVMGWSNGGYLTNCLITLKNSPIKFKAASSGAGIVDTVAEWGFNDEPAYPMVFKKGLPWEQPELYKKSSPTYGLGNATTPTLIHVGGNDERCPPGHSKMLYRALKEYNKVPAELIVYPGEPHGLTKLTNRKAKMEWDLAWFDKYVR